MPMNARLLRPIASGVHPDANDWRSRVVANGGSVSASTMRAVSKFCADIDKAGIRDRFWRLNLFCGNSDGSLFAVRTPLYRGPSRAGTQYGNTTDTNSNFVSGDYVETGASGGLTGNGSNKSLNTGLAPSALSTNSRHIAAYVQTKTSGTFQTYIGCRTDGTGPGNWFNIWQTTANNLTMHCLGTNAGSDTGNVSGYAVGLFQANNDASTGTYYSNGATADTADTGRTPLAGSTRNVTVFALNFEGGVGVHVDSRLGGYSIGEFMNATQAAAYYTAMQAFQTALGRQV